MKVRYCCAPSFNEFARAKLVRLLGFWLTRSLARSFALRPAGQRREKKENEEEEKEEAKSALKASRVSAARCTNNAQNKKRGGKFALGRENKRARAREILLSLHQSWPRVQAARPLGACGARNRCAQGKARESRRARFLSGAWANELLGSGLAVKVARNLCFVVANCSQRSAILWARAEACVAPALRGAINHSAHGDA